jgi:hypothetical protein
MTTAKIALLAAVAAVFSFALGIYFHSSLPTGSREIASLSSRIARTPNSKMDPRVSVALKNCMGEKVEPGKVLLNKVVVDGRSWAIVSMDCVGENAKQLYEAVGPYSSEQYVSYSDKRRGVARFFGRLYPPSQCVRVIRTARGSELNLYSCSVRIDLDHELVEALKL